MGGAVQRWHVGMLWGLERTFVESTGMIRGVQEASVAAVTEELASVFIDRVLVDHGEIAGLMIGVAGAS